jgi:hypothetical protein
MAERRQLSLGLACPLRHQRSLRCLTSTIHKWIIEDETNLHSPSEGNNVSHEKLHFSLMMLCCALFALLVGCSSNHSGIVAESAAPALSGNPPLSLPLPAQLTGIGHQASSSYGVVLGKQYNKALPNNRISYFINATLRFMPPASGDPTLGNCAYVLYSVPLDQDGDLSWLPAWYVQPASGQAYVGFGNLTKNRWDWRKQQDPTQPVMLASSSDYISVDHIVLIAIVVLPNAIRPELDSFTLRSAVGGWQFAELYSYETTDSAMKIDTPQLAVVNGKPAVAFTRYNWDNPNAQVIELRQLALCSTATGENASDWHLIDPQISSGSETLFSAVGSGYAMLNTVNLGGDNREYHYYYSTDPASGFSDEVVFTTTNPSGPIGLSDVGGKPALVYIEQLAGDQYTYYPHYARSETASGGTWHATKICDLKTSYAPFRPVAAAVEYAAKPLVAFVTHTSTDTTLVIAQPSTSFPTLDTDWSTLNLGPAYGDFCNLQLLDSKPCAFTNYTRFTTEAPFSLAQLTGADPLNLSDWALTDCKSLGLGTLTAATFFTLPNQACVALTKTVSPDPHLGYAETLSFISSSAPTDAPAAWATEMVSTAQPGGSFFQFIDLNGQPAFAGTQLIHADYDADRYIWKVVYGVYVP